MEKTPEVRPEARPEASVSWCGVRGASKEPLPKAVEVKVEETLKEIELPFVDQTELLVEPYPEQPPFDP